MRKTVPIGKVKFGNKVLVSDPMYQVGTWCTALLDNVKAGTYNAEVDIADCGELGKRVGAIRVRHKDYMDVCPEFAVGGDSCGAGVDSGLCGFWDYDKFAKIKGNKTENEKFFNRLLNINKYGVEKFGVLSSTGFGDGAYPIYAGFADGEIVSLEVEFIADGEENE